ncbi:hypothetical protein ZYGR_0CT00100 [Zygosaccharomyces rouxii]|uniref:Uncharacterized protein n=1 Tax=Zygosaccharomyces rouxii TaxID=4956 RepID=A0A1Q3AL84_ZYGRO|nr:hypothetical protein ZYGR_0CT00100 [Zygosaccharomyces rouxii]
MYLISILVTAVLLLGVLANSQPFNLITLLPGSPVIPAESPLENASIYFNQEQLYIAQGAAPTMLIIDYKGHLKLNDGKYFQAGPEGQLSQATESAASPDFSIKNGYLYHNNTELFVAIQKRNAYVLSVKKPEGMERNAVVAVYSSNGDVEPDFP